MTSLSSMSRDVHFYLTIRNDEQSLQRYKQTNDNDVKDSLISINIVIPIKHLSKFSKESREQYLS